MKKYLIALSAMLMLCSTSLMAQSSENSYSKNGTLEFGGTVSFSYTNYTGQKDYYGYYNYNNEIYSFGFNPILNYYFFDSIHAGIVPAFSVDIAKNDTATSKYLAFGPKVSIGYTFTINSDLYFDISPAYSYLTSGSYENENSHEFSYYSNYSLTLALKFIINNKTLINVYLEEGYTDYSSDYAVDGKYNVLLGAGVTSFVNF